MVTMTTVAAMAHVSVSTVSHVVNGTRPVSPETRSRVLQAMDALGFEHHPIARSLQSGSARTIGLALTAASNPYWTDLVSGIDLAASAAGLSLIMVDTRDEPRHEATVVANLLAHHVDGLIVAPSGGWEGQLLPMLRDRATPYVLIDRTGPVRVDQVAVESEQSSAAVVEHLLVQGHRRVAVVTGAPGLSTSEDRERGYRLAHARLGVPVDEALVVCGGSTEHGGRSATLRLLSEIDPPTALFTSNNLMTIGALGALRQLGRRVPDDLALVSYDDFSWAEVFSPSLTTVAQPLRDLGRTAVQLLVRRLNDPQAPTQIVRLPAEIRHRESCGCLA
ncbi:LacI family DNA-binding transcriptional regulator [Arsenicicoccus piscis]|uniref:LacI family transcriptional regulator n=1 Tax=Arsenicicoccus piscis TaxID=673954 RepID=A0ABQ6HSC8_9MICO|nr:LacI family DNA-binding transcriptional regulator [Arsenicicoccus piscis]MCH8626713.1 LacI family DNA-binding transcriptional regulator [Arsenicicoccus piscis]GMA21388.1 LacI family transcriptional regulator [Arsenicicoccus piscis]